MPFSCGLTIPRLSDIESFLNKKMSSSYYTNVYRLPDTAYGDLIVKRNKIGEEKKEVFEELFADIKEYREALINLGIPVSKWLYADIQQEDDGWHYWIIERYAGEGFQEEVAKLGLRASVEQLMERVMIPLLKSTKEQYLKYGIDTPLRNFAFSPAYGVTYVDLFPPKLHRGNDFILEHPNPTDEDCIFIGKFNKYLKRGVFYTMFINLCREYPTQRQFFLDAFHDLANKIGHLEYVETLVSSPAHTILDLRVEDAVNLVRGWSLRGEGYFQFRDMAFAIAARHSGLIKEIPQICHLTHPDHHTGEFLMPNDVAEAKQILISALHDLKNHHKITIEW